MKDQNGMGDQDIHLAARKGDLTELQRIVNEKADAVEANGWFGTKPLHYAARSGSLECVRFLLDKGAHVNARCIVNRTTAIFEASTAEIAEFLIEQGAELDVVSTKGRVPLDYAAQGLHEGTVRVLLQHGADPNYRPKTNHFHTMMQWAMTERGQNFDGNRCRQIITMLLHHGAEPNIANVFGWTALHEACQCDLIDVVRLLLEHDADPNLRNRDCRSAFDLAAGKDEILALMAPLRREIQEQPKPEQTPEQLIERLFRKQIISEKDLSPCSEDDIAELERLHGLSLPETYKTFLRRMGRGAGCFLTSDHWSVFYEELCDSTGLGGKVTVDDLEELELPQNFFIFASRLDDVHFYFVADGKSDDPPIFSWNDSGDQGQVYESFWGFIEEMVEYYEFYCDPEQFSRSV